MGKTNTNTLQLAGLEIDGLASLTTEEATEANGGVNADGVSYGVGVATAAGIGGVAFGPVGAVAAAGAFTVGYGGVRLFQWCFSKT